MLKAIGNTHRLLMLCALAQRPMAVCDLNRRVPIAQSALSQHLARLRSAGLVVAQRDGPRIRYALANARTRRLIEAVCTEYRIRDFVADPAAAPAGSVHAEPADTGEALAPL
ncbi:ArsR/SmtB family transcription factor [Immundisolibacter sp.]|uniref:ArsR/SmtB family transcription factor n=1 Tax=Immundisolibacter sp. TaxID=1934948 RepID=UPI0025C1B7BD|nr:metalloregulator ArsR/SmtB family transcription factor [Immundisolibacter sp.]